MRRCAFGASSLALVGACSAASSSGPAAGTGAPTASSAVVFHVASASAVGPRTVAPAMTSSARVSESGPCVGSLFDFGDLPKPCFVRQGTPSEQTTALEVSFRTDTKSVRAGRTVGAMLVFTNTSGNEVELVLQPGCELFEVQAFSGGQRADYLTDCDYGRGCGRGKYRVVLLPNGEIVKKLEFTARRTKEMAATNCSPIVSPLAPGRYELRVGVADFFLADAVKKVRATIDVVP